MKDKNIYIIAGVVVIILAIVFFAKPKETIGPTGEGTEDQNKVEDRSNTSNTGTVTKTNPSGQTIKASQNTTTKILTSNFTANLPSLDFIDKVTSLSIKDFPGAKITIQKIAFGRKDAVISAKCGGIPNANFSIYLYPGEICISDSEVDGSPRGIVSFHVLLENNGQIGIGGNPNTFRLHYLRSDSSGKPVHRFAYPLIDIESYYVNSYSSKEMMFSYLVPEDQLIYDFVVGYKESPTENKTLNVYDSSTNGLLVDFGSKTIKVVK